MIRPEFRKLLMDQRGAAVILWSFFMMSIVIYIVIAHNVLDNPKYARGLSFAETARIVLWILVWSISATTFSGKSAISRHRRFFTTLRRQNFLEPCRNTRGPSKSVPQRSYQLS